MPKSVSKGVPKGVPRSSHTSQQSHSQGGSHTRVQSVGPIQKGGSGQPKAINNLPRNLPKQTGQGQPKGRRGPTSGPVR